MKLQNLAFLKTKTFSKNYSSITLTILSLSIIFNFMGVAGNLLVQGIAGLLIICSVALLLGQISLILNHVNRKDMIGSYIVRLSYVTIFILILAMFLMTMGQLVASFYILDGASMQANLVYSSIGMTSMACFGICLSGICYHTRSMENVWN